LLILPSPFTVLKTWIKFGFTNEFLKAELLTLARIFTGFIIGCFLGFLTGIITHISNVVYLLLSPVLKIIRAIPVVAIIILMYLFFSSSTLPILIVCLMVLPIVWQTVHDGLKNTDKSLLEMARVFNLTNSKTLISVKLPSIIPSLISSFVNALGLAWKSGVAAEVICYPQQSIGRLLYNAKTYLETPETFAVTLVIVIISLALERAVKYFVKRWAQND